MFYYNEDTPGNSPSRVFGDPMIESMSFIDNQPLLLNVASTRTGTRALGPGIRSVVWVQGCVLHCPGCIAPDWIPIKPARLVSPGELVDELLSNPAVSGLTFSGGEPMLQAQGLARLAALAHMKRDVNIICFTGYIFEQLLQNPPFPGVDELLKEVDVVVDGPYIARYNDNIGLRGSSNQRIHYLTDRLSQSALDRLPRTSEIEIIDGQVMMIGVPPVGMELALEQALGNINRLRWDAFQHERI